MVRLQLITSWQGEGTFNNPYTMYLPESLPSNTAWRDVTIQSNIFPSPNSCVIEIETTAIW